MFKIQSTIIKTSKLPLPQIQHLALSLAFLISFAMSFQTNAQTMISLSGSPSIHSKLKSKVLNESDFKGSKINSEIATDGVFYSLDLTQYFESKIGLKFGLSFGNFTQDLSFGISTEFLDTSSWPSDYESNFIFTTNNFGVLNIGGILPIKLTEKSSINISLSGMTSIVFGQDEQVSLCDLQFGEFGPFKTVYFESQTDYKIDEIQLGVNSEILYEFHPKNTNLSFHAGLIAGYSFQPYMKATLDFIAPDPVMAEVSGLLSYLGGKLGISYTFNSSIFQK